MGTGPQGQSPILQPPPVFTLLPRKPL